MKRISTWTSLAVLAVLAVSFPATGQVQGTCMGDFADCESCARDVYDDIAGINPFLVPIAQMNYLVLLADCEIDLYHCLGPIAHNHDYAPCPGAPFPL